MGSPNKQQGQLSKEEIDFLKEQDNNLLLKVSAVFIFLGELLLTIGKLGICLIMSVMIGLATVKSIELYNDAKLDLEAEITIHQRLL